MTDYVINTLSITPPAGGLKTYLVEILERLLEIDAGNNYLLLCSPLNRSVFAFANRFPNATIQQLKRHPGGPVARVFYDQVIVPRIVARNRNAVLITPSSVASLYARNRQVTLILAPLCLRSVRTTVPRSRSTVTRLQALYFRLLMPLSMRRSSAVVAISHHLAKALEAEHGRHVDVVRAGVDAEPPQSGNASESPDSAGPYVLFVSTLFPYKNVDRLLQGFAKMCARENVPADLVLKIAGRDPDGRQLVRLHALADTLGIAHRTQFLGPIPHEDIWPLYERARVFVYPSSIETFGIPILEAMRADVPVVAARRMSIPEVAGDAAILVDPDDIDALAMAMEQVVNDDGLRAALVRAGRIRVLGMNWDQSARDMQAVLRRVADSATHLET
ncbi:MAG TPA: glycosyltransferase family 1 protein [Gemmatimonadaceae bacterium]